MILDIYVNGLPVLIFFYLFMLVDYPLRRGQDRMRQNAHKGPKKQSMWIGVYGAVFVVLSLLNLLSISGVVAMFLAYTVAWPIGAIVGIAIFIGMLMALSSHVDMRTNFYARYLEE